MSLPREINRSKKLADEIAATREENGNFRRHLLSDAEKPPKETPTEARAKTLQDLRKKIQKAEAELQEVSAKGEAQQQQLDKSVNVLRRELGEFATLDLVSLRMSVAAEG